jgi:hypothetical protein
LVNGSEQVLVPEYVPEIVLLVTPAADPLMVIVQFGNAETPPTGTAMVNVNVVPLRLPERFPRNWRMPAGVDAVMVPVTAVPVCEMTHDILLGPEESDALPE